MVDFAELNSIDLSGSEEMSPDVEKQEESLPISEEPNEEQSPADKQKNEETGEEYGKNDGAAGEVDAEINTVTELATELGIEPSQLYDLQVPMGEGVEPVSLSAMKDAYQTYQREKTEFDKQREEINQQRAQLDLERSSINQPTEIDPRIKQAEAELNEINATYNNINWALFEKENPGEAALQKQKFQEAFNLSLAKKEMAINTVDQERSSAETQYNNEQARQLVQMIPEWKDTHQYQSDRLEIREALNEYGFTENDIQGLRDAKAIKLIHDYVKLKNGVKNAKPISAKKESSAVLKAGVLRRDAKSKVKLADQIVAKGANSKDKSVKAQMVTDLLNTL